MSSSDSQEKSMFYLYLSDCRCAGRGWPQEGSCESTTTLKHRYACMEATRKTAGYGCNTCAIVWLVRSVSDVAGKPFDVHSAQNLEHVVIDVNTLQQKSPKSHIDPPLKGMPTLVHICPPGVSSPIRRKDSSWRTTVARPKNPSRLLGVWVRWLDILTAKRKFFTSPQSSSGDETTPDLDAQCLLAGL